MAQAQDVNLPKCWMVKQAKAVSNGALCKISCIPKVSASCSRSELEGLSMSRRPPPSPREAEHVGLNPLLAAAITHVSSWQ